MPPKKIRIILFVFLIFEAFLSLKADKIDSLKISLRKAGSDQLFFETCIQLGSELRSANMDSAVFYHELAFQRSKKLTALQRMEAENELAYDKIKKKDVESGQALLKKVNAELLGLIAGKKESPKVYNILEWNYEYLGLALRKKDSLYEAMNYFEKSLDIAVKTENLPLQSDLCNNLAQTLYMLGSYPKSLDYCLKGLKVNEKRKSKQGIASSTGNAGILFKELGDYQKALEYFESALQMNKELNNQKSVAVNLGNIGVAYNHLGKKDLAFKYYSEAADKHNQIGSREGLIYNYNNIGVLYNENKDQQKAIGYYEKALAIAKELDDKYTMAHTYIYIGSSNTALQNYGKAQEFLDKGFTLCKMLNAVDLIQEYYQAQSELYNRTHQFEKALDAYKNYIEYRDSIVNEGNLRKSIQLETNHRYAKKISEDSILHVNETLISNTKLEKKNAELKADRNLQLGLYGCLGLSLISIIFIYNRFKITSKQKNVIHKQKEMAEHQKQLIEEKQKEIIDSINYAKRIQFTLLAHDDVLKRNLSEYFVMFKPKDIVSGDFYWAIEKHDREKGEKNFYLAVCDSTGHGVPGAFMGLLNTSFLNEAVNEKNIYEPAKVFDYVRARLIDSLSKEERQDGMDAILVKFTEGKNEISYAASYNQPLIIRNGEMIQQGYDKIPIGKSDKKADFTEFNFTCQKGDMLYLYTDGYADQFGGNGGRKLKEANLKKLFLEISGKDPQEQQRILESEFDKWQGDLEQVDDVCIIGVRL